MTGNRKLIAMGVIAVMVFLIFWASRPFWITVNVERGFVSTDGRLHHAIESGTLEQVRSLNESDPTLFDRSLSPFGNPFDVALFYQRLDVIEYFARSGYDVNQQMYNSEYQNYTPIGYATEVLQRPAAVERLLQLGADPALTVNGGKSALQLAEENGLDEIASILKEAKSQAGE
ncbi:ankyrin repeat domain-containing protein [Aeoliella sp.]|uniref:ankyrin repeat domain-containing protein n=1 Tax=Aeoliella sp. TaxID=2795800 RepID=UPI003CCB78EE